MQKRISCNDFAELFGSSVADIKEKVGRLVDKIDPLIDVLEGSARDELILRVLKRTDSIELKAAGETRSPDWEDGWQENLDEFIAGGYSTGALKPKYYKQNVPHRFAGEFVLPAEPDFVYKYTEIFREWLFKTFFAEYHAVYEFGCGTGHNLVHLGRIFPEKKLFGLDWAKSSQKIINLLREKSGLNIYGRSFNFFKPDNSFHVESGAAVFTFGALEQTGSGYREYLEYILSQRPGICLDVAGINDFYSDASLMDYLALLYHNRRNYLNNYYAYLSELEKNGRLRIVKHHKHEFGNLYDDPYSYIAWKPL